MCTHHCCRLLAYIHDLLTYIGLARLSALTTQNQRVILILDGESGYTAGGAAQFGSTIKIWSSIWLGKEVSSIIVFNKKWDLRCQTHLSGPATSEATAIHSYHHLVRFSFKKIILSDADSTDAVQGAGALVNCLLPKFLNRCSFVGENRFSFASQHLQEISAA